MCNAKFNILNTNRYLSIINIVSHDVMVNLDHHRHLNAPEFTIFNTEFTIFNKEFIMFNTEFTIFNTEFIMFNTGFIVLIQISSHNQVLLRGLSRQRQLEPQRLRLCQVHYFKPKNRIKQYKNSVKTVQNEHRNRTLSCISSAFPVVPVVCIEFIIVNAKLIIFNTKFIIFNTNRYRSPDGIALGTRSHSSLSGSSPAFPSAPLKREFFCPPIPPPYPRPT